MNEKGKSTLKIFGQMTKEEKILHELYRKSFAKSTPYGDWDQLLSEAKINELGQKVIPYWEYECEHELLEQIFEETMKKYIIKGFKKQQFKTTFMLGCTPKSKFKKK